MREGVKHWTRAQDLSAALDDLLTHSAFKNHLDTSRVMAAGFSYGGWTALSLGGMTSNHQGFVDACKAYGERLTACDLLMSERVNLPGVDKTQWEASYRDNRITHVVAIDPGLVWGLTPENGSNVIDNVLLIGLGTGDDRMLATDFDTSGLLQILPDVGVERLVPASHFTAMPLCKPGGEEILELENDDPVCTDPPGTDRAQVHSDIIKVITGQLGL